MKKIELESDRALLDAFRRGDANALDSVYSRYAPRVLQLLRHGFTFNSSGRSCQYTGAATRFDLEDRLQDVFARAFAERARLAYDGISPYEAYLVTIAKNLVIDRFRRQSRRLQQEFMVEDIDQMRDASANAEADGGADPEVQVEAKDVAELVKRFKEGLDSREHTVFVLRFEAHEPHPVIREKTGLSDSRIKTVEKRIRRQFYRFMRAHGYFEGYEQKESGWLQKMATRLRGQKT